MSDAFDADLALRALAHAGRRQMVALVWDGERTSGELARRCRLSRPATSQHLKVLQAAGLVEVRARGNERRYRARREGVAEVRALLDRFWGSRLDALRAALEEDGGRVDLVSATAGECGGAFGEATSALDGDPR